MASKNIIQSIVVTAIFIIASGVVIAAPAPQDTSASMSINALGMGDTDWSFLASESDWGKTKAVGMNYGTYTGSYSQLPSAPSKATAPAPVRVSPPARPALPSSVLNAVARTPVARAVVIPVPTSLLLLGSGLLGLFFIRYRVSNR